MYFLVIFCIVSAFDFCHLNVQQILVVPTLRYVIVLIIDDHQFGSGFSFCDVEP